MWATIVKLAAEKFLIRLFLIKEDISLKRIKTESPYVDQAKQDKAAPKDVVEHILSIQVFAIRQVMSRCHISQKLHREETSESKGKHSRTEPIVDRQDADQDYARAEEFCDDVQSWLSGLPADKAIFKDKQVFEQSTDYPHETEQAFACDQETLGTRNIVHDVSKDHET